MADGRAVRDILWPHDALVTALDRADVSIVPDGETVLMEGDVIIVRCETREENETLKQLTSIVGTVLSCERHVHGAEVQTEEVPA